MKNPLLSLALLAAAGLGSLAHAQDNLYPLQLVTSTGAPLPQESGEYVAPTSNVFIKLPSNLPSGTYWTQITDEVPSQLLSTDLLSARAWRVVNNSGVLSITQIDTTQGTKTLGTCPTGSDTIPVLPHVYASATNCKLKFWLADTVSGPEWYDFLGTGIRSFGYYRVEKDTGIPPRQVDVCAFVDTNENGTRDVGESPLPGMKITATLGGSSTTVERTTDANGEAQFTNLADGFWTVAIQTTSNYTSTTKTSFDVESGPCVGGQKLLFGKAPLAMNCAGHTPGYWRNKHGLGYIETNGLLPALNGLPLVGDDGSSADFADLGAYKAFMKDGRARNMAYMLSVQSTAMWLNRHRGFVSGGCQVVLPNNAGLVSIDVLLANALAALDAYLDPGKTDPTRAEMEYLKNLLDAANNNQNWAN